MRSKLVTPPSTEPITLDELKLFLRIDNADEDALLNSYIEMARQKVETLSNRSFITQTWRKVLDYIPGISHSKGWWDGTKTGSIGQMYSEPRYILLELGPVQSIDSFKYYNSSNDESVYASSNYFLDDAGNVNRLVKNDDALWPSPLRSYSSIHIDYITGYGNAAAVPESIKMAIKLLASHYYENRGECSDSEIPSSIMTLISCFSVKRLG